MHRASVIERGLDYQRLRGANRDVSEVFNAALERYGVGQPVLANVVEKAEDVDEVGFAGRVGAYQDVEVVEANINGPKALEILDQ
jgi:hypothetical protein